MNQTIDTAPIGAASLVAARKVQRRRAIRIVSLFVVVPTLLVGLFTAFVQSKFYESYAVVSVEPTSPSATGADVRGDARFLREFALSRDGFEYLVEHAGYREHFGSGKIDFRSRLPRSASNEEAYAHYQRHVNVELDAETGFLLVRTRAHSGGQAKRFTTALLAAMASRMPDVGAGDAEHPESRLAIVATPSLPDAPAGPRVLRAVLTVLFGSIALLVIVSMVISTALEHADV